MSAENSGSTGSEAASENIEASTSSRATVTSEDNGLERHEVESTLVANKRAKPTTETEDGLALKKVDDQASGAAVPSSTSTTTTIGAASTTTSSTQGAVSETTVYCDACGKARVLKTSFAETFDLSKEWSCKEACVQGCDQPDDEITNIAGDMFAKVLDVAGIKTRKQLANSSSEEFDSGPWEAYILQWIGEARLQEMNDAMREIFENDEQLIDDLGTIGITSPVTLLQFDQANLLTACREVLQIDDEDLEAQVQSWRSVAESLANDMPWMYQMGTAGE